jgi:hypothetical protein
MPSEAAPTSYHIFSRNVKMTMMRTFKARREAALPVCLEGWMDFVQVIGPHENNYITWRLFKEYLFVMKKKGDPDNFVLIGINAGIAQSV